MDVADVESMVLLTRRESKTEPPNYMLRDLSSNSSQRITSFPHPQPQLSNVYQEVIRYKRADGVDLPRRSIYPAMGTARLGMIPARV